ncbi:MAG: hypothetical protein ACFE0Q_02310 [Anaerolineae bacterium]
MHKLWILMLMIAISACTTQTTATPETLITVAPEPLEQTYNTILANGSISLSYPAEWFISGDFPELGLVIANSETLANNSFDGEVGDDGVYIEILFAPKSILAEGNTPQSVLETISGSVSDPEGTVSEITTTTLNGNSTALLTLDSADSADGMQLVVDSGDAFSTIVAAVPNENLHLYRATIEAIAGSIQYTLLQTPAESTDEADGESAEATEAMESEATEEAPPSETTEEAP